MWNGNGFPTQSLQHISRKLKKLATDLRAAQKCETTAKSKMFKQSLMELFDISCIDIVNRISSDKDLSDFWATQAFTRNVLTFKSHAKNKQTNQQDSSLENIEPTVEDDIADDDTTTDPDHGDEATTSSSTKKRKRIKIITDMVVENLDREKVSNRETVGLIASIASSLGTQIDDLTISKSTSHRKRKQVRRVCILYSRRITLFLYLQARPRIAKTTR